jgi:hypothetical protein
MKLYFYLNILLVASLINACSKSTTSNNSTTNTTYTGTGSVTQGVAKTTISSLYSCAGGRVTAVGTITSTDGKIWTVPAENNFSTGPKLPDLYNECNGKTPAYMAQVDTASIPTTIIDADGEVITGYLYGDNYYELYVNGKLVGVDAVPFTPFNSSFVKFKAKRPIKYAIKLVDWEENLGIGSEANGGDAYHAGDGGFAAKFSDGSSTSTAWKAQTFYIAPLASPNCVTETGTSRISSSCNTIGAGANAYALHWTVPTNWYASDYDFSSWPSASTFTEAEVGVKTAYTNFSTQFSGAKFIWSNNLILDNLVLLRFNGN